MTLNSAVLDVPTSENTGHHAVSTAAAPLSFENVGQSFPVPGYRLSGTAPTPLAHRSRQRGARTAAGHQKI